MTGGSDGKDGEGEPVKRLLHALRTTVRDDDAAVAACPTDVIPMLTETARASIAAELLRTVSGGRKQAAADDLSKVRRQTELRRVGRLGRVGWTAGAAVLAAAAAFVLWTRSPVEPRFDDMSQGLPDYTVAVSGGAADTRGAIAGDGTNSRPAAAARTPAVRVRSGSELRISCRPETAVVGAVRARAFFVHDGAVAEVKPAVRIADTGAVELRLPAAALGAAVQAGPTVTAGAGRAPRDELRVVLGRPETIAALTAADVDKPHTERPRERAAQRWFVLPLDLSDRER